MTVDRGALDADVPGWLPEVDFHFIQWFLRDQAARHIGGDLVELGVYLGKSAVVIGDFVAPGETFTVVDLFEAPANEASNRTENEEYYDGLTQSAFEANYRRFHSALPVTHRGFSSEIRTLAADGTVRFCHVDASHLYEHVRVDVESARALLREDGVVVFDDYRSPHTPGVSAAVWEAVVRDDLHPLLLTSQKFYGTWSDPSPFLDRLTASIDREFEVQDILGHRVIRVPSEPVPVEPTRAQLLAKALVPQRLKPALKAARDRVRAAR